MIGIEPWAYSLRDLVAMHEATVRQQWNHTAQILAILCELQRNPKRRSRPFTADEFHPYSRRRVRRGTPLTHDVLHAQMAHWKARQKPHKEAS